ncbi:MAG TPA: phospho-sugar mutase [Clostridiales bacterium]|jgi:phosphoglucomutase|nr:phospho-sugar mutase [Clostridiales bacterium]
MDYMREYEHWRRVVEPNSEYYQELLAIEGDEKEIEDRFYKQLEFGTAGLRGIMGAGTNRMNEYVVGQATQGLADLLSDIPEACERGVVIGYDSRNKSEQFAKIAAGVLAQNGIRVYLYESLRTVPQLSFAIRHYSCIAGIMITASHNPPQYNGYKVYWEHGGQLDPMLSSTVTRKINGVNIFDVLSMDIDTAINKGLVQLIGKEVDDTYYSCTKSLLLHKELINYNYNPVDVVYTPLHGAGLVPVRELLVQTKLCRLHIVKEQEEPNGNFPTVKTPNPEDFSAFELAVKLADQVGADLILATDPDSDRLGVAVRDNIGKFVHLTGNQIGCLLLYYILSSLKEKDALNPNGMIVKSIVSTKLADKICEDFCVKCVEVLTGFRFIAEKIAESDDSPTSEFIFGFEESYGFLAGSYVRDKDAICASMLMVEAFAYYKSIGKTLFDVLNEMYERYGYFVEATKSYEVQGIDGMKRIADTMTALRNESMQEIAGQSIVAVEDYKAGKSRCVKTGRESDLVFPESDVIRIILENGWLSIRPSGTEPKLKAYFGISSKSKEEAKAIFDAVFNEVCGWLDTHIG